MKVCESGKVSLSHKSFFAKMIDFKEERPILLYFFFQKDKNLTFKSGSMLTLGKIQFSHSSCRFKSLSSVYHHPKDLLSLVQLLSKSL